MLLGEVMQAQDPSFKTKTREVIVPVSVLTKAGKPVEGLAEEDFKLLDDGRPQSVHMLSSDASPLPINAVIVVQVDGDSAPAIAKIKKTASLISGYITNDMGLRQPSQAAVVTVADEVKLAENFTADPDRLKAAFAGVSTTGSSSRLIDGVSLACDLLAATNPAARRVIVLISESRDAGSKSHFADVVVKAQKNDVVIYTISYSAFLTAFTQRASERPAPPDQPGLYDPSSGGGGMNLLAIPALLAQLAKTNVAQAFAQTTGGSHEKFNTLRGLETELAAIGTEIHNRYVLTFVPPETQAAGFHELTVTMRKAGDWQVHARAGYWSTVF